MDMATQASLVQRGWHCEPYVIMLGFRGKVDSLIHHALHILLAMHLFTLLFPNDKAYR